MNKSPHYISHHSKTTRIIVKTKGIMSSFIIVNYYCFAIVKISYIFLIYVCINNHHHHHPQAKLESYTSVDLSSDESKESQTDSHILELKLKALILDTIHNIDVVSSLIRANTTSPSDWEWQKQLRFVIFPHVFLPLLCMCRSVVLRHLQNRKSIM